MRRARSTAPAGTSWRALHDQERLLRHRGSDPGSRHAHRGGGRRRSPPPSGTSRGCRCFTCSVIIGFDTISLARRGARVTGVDFSAPALARASETGPPPAGLHVEWVEGDAAASCRSSLNRRFDLAYATVGVITWIGELRRLDALGLPARCAPAAGWCSSTATRCRTWSQSPDPLDARLPLRRRRGRSRSRAEQTYADLSRCGSSPTGPASTTPHSIGEIVSTAAGAGLSHRRADRAPLRRRLSTGPGIDHLQEPDGRWRLRIGGQPMPVLFTLQSDAPGLSSRTGLGG